MTSVCIVGIGFVGESLINVFCRMFNVIAVDISQTRINELKSKYRHVMNKFKFITVDDCDQDNLLNDCVLFCIAVPTLLNHNGLVDDTHIKNAINFVGKYAQPKSSVVIESSVCVGMTRKLLMPLCDHGIFAGFSPERIDPGREHPNPHEIPKVISGLNKESLDHIAKLYGSVFEHIVPVSSCEIAETTKLVENSFRMVNIAYSCEVDSFCKKMGINTYEVINACATKPFGYMPFYPCLSVGGSCIPVNPVYLFSSCNCENDMNMLACSTKMMLTRPASEVDKLLSDFPDTKTVLVVGIGYKPGQSSCIYSPGLRYAQELVKRGVHVSVYDPLVAACGFDVLESQHVNIEYLETHFDVICVAIKQSGVDWEVIKKHKHVIRYCDI